jgi:homoserine O-acetyltransferase/O-succinyltransferase
LHEQVADSVLAILQSDYGHDGFLVETAQLEQAIREFYATEKVNELYYENSEV